MGWRAVGATASASALIDGPAGQPDRATTSRVVRLFRGLRVARRGVAILCWTGIACCIQSVLLLLPGRAKADFARAYWSIACVLLGMHIRVIGSPISSRHDRGRSPRQPERSPRPVIYVSNHSSWIDVPVLGGRLLGCFVAKEDVGGWPLVGTVARLGRTIFVSRQRKATGRERDDMRQRLAGGDDLILFPEGTSSDGSRVLPFHSSFFAAAKPNGSQGPADEADAVAPCPLVQPISIVYDRLGGLPIGRSNRPVFAWYGDMDLASHFTRLARWRGMRATILLHPVLDPADFPTRKALSIAAWTAVAEGAAALRQNRIGDAPVKIFQQPARDSAEATFPLDSTGPSFA